VLCYTGLAAHLADAGQPVYGLVAAGLDGAGEPLATVEEMAADYLRAVEEAGLLKAGEIVLGGWSMGGLVAYEMARTLGRKTGVTPPLLLLDGYPPGAAEDRLADDDAAFLSWFAYDWGQNLGHELAVPEKELAGAATFLDGVALVLDRARAAGAAGLELDAATLARVAAVVRANVRAANRYRPEPGHTGPITVLAAEAEPGAADPAHGWPSWTSGVVRGLRVPGDHYGILQKSHLQALADVVVASLDTHS